MISSSESSLALGLLASYLLFQASTPIVDSIWGIGPRYAAAMLPFLMLGVVCIKSALELKAFY